MSCNRSHFNDAEWAVRQAGKCCYQTGYGLPWDTYCEQPSAEGSDELGYCLEHTEEINQQEAQ